MGGEDEHGFGHGHEESCAGAEKEVAVFTQANVLRVNDIEQTVTVDFVLAFFYKLENLKTGRGDRFKRIAPPEWTLHERITFFDLMQPAETFEVTYFANEVTGEVFGNLNWVLTITERLELQRFPFDRQELSVTFEADDVRLVPWTDELNRRAPVDVASIAKQCNPRQSRGGSADSASDVGDRDQLQFTLGAESNMWRLESARVGVTNVAGFGAMYRLRANIERRSFFYLVNICFLMLLLGLSACVVTGLDIKESFNDRISYLMTLILAFIAFKFVMTGLVPKTNYLSVMDWYTIGGFVFLMLVLLKDFVIQMVVDNHEYARRVDRISMAAYAGCWTFVHLVFVLLAWRGAFFRPWNSVTTDQSAGDEDRHFSTHKTQNLTEEQYRAAVLADDPFDSDDGDG